MSNQAGKGDTPRPVDPKKYGENYDRIFRRNPKTQEGKESKLILTLEDAINYKWPKPQFEWENKQ